MVDFVKVTDNESLKQIACLADEIWHDHFIDIIGKDQTDYMVEKFQSYAAMTEQIKEKSYSYYALIKNNKAVGYFAIVPDNEKLFLSKLYIHKSQRGNNYASHALDFMKKYCRENELNAIWLTVNRHNQNTIDIYLHCGFEIVREQAADIGNGFIMDDYVMEMRVENE